MNIKGWFLSTNKNAEVQVLVDDVDVSNQIKRVLREDAIKVYGNDYNAKSGDLVGYEGNINVSDFSNFRSIFQ